jgi:hypothetical protein
VLERQDTHGKLTVQYDATTYRMDNGTHPHLQFPASRTHATARSPRRTIMIYMLVMLHCERVLRVSEHRLCKFWCFSPSPGKFVYHLTPVYHPTPTTPTRSSRNSSAKYAAPATLDCDSPVTHHDNSARPQLENALESPKTATWPLP